MSPFKGKSRPKKLTPKLKGFSDDFLKTGNGAEAARRNYKIGSRGGKINSSTARTIAAENLAKPSVREYLKGIAQDMAEIVNEIARKGETHTVRLNAAKDVLDRAGYKPVDAIDVTSGGEIIKSIEYVTPLNGSTKP